MSEVEVKEEMELGGGEENGADEGSGELRKPLKDQSEFTKRMQRRGVVYISRIPPRMMPDHIRRFLGDYATVERVYLVPEDESRRLERVRRGGDKTPRFVEGWVEFADKKQARTLAQGLHMTAIGGGKGVPFREDLWNMRYLPRFKWHHLMERMHFERRVRAERLRMEMKEAKKETEDYVAQAEASRAILELEKKKLKKAVEGGELDASEAAAGALPREVAEKRSKVHRSFHQLPTINPRARVGEKRSRGEEDEEGGGGKRKTKKTKKEKKEKKRKG